MIITIRLFAQFREGRFAEAERPFPEGVDCRHVILALGLRPGEVGILLMNGQHAHLDDPLKEKDTLALFPLIGGG